MPKKQDSGAWRFFVAFGIVILIFVGFYAFNAWQLKQVREENMYNGFAFQQTESGVWATNFEINDQLYIIPFHHHPRDVEDVIVHEGVLEPLYSRPDRIFISIDPDAGSRPVVAGVEISKLTGHKYNLINIPTSSALSRPANKSVDVPIVTCDDATNSTTVIQFVHDPTANAIVRDGNCVILFYKTPEDSIRVADRYAFALLRVM